MWTRSLLKSNAKQVLWQNYWKAFLVCLVAEFLAGGSLGSRVLSYNYSSDAGHYNYHNVYGFADVSILGRYASAITGFALALALIGIAFSIFVGSPTLVGKSRFFMENRVGCSPFSTLFSTIGGPAYLNVVKVMLLKNLFIFLWSLLFVFPGIYKTYQYRMVDYLLAENPYMTYGRAFELSRQMTEGEKFNMFILDLSFFGWLFLGAMLFGIGALFVSPYIEATYAELYAALRAKAFSLNLSDENELSGFVRY